MAHSPLHTHPGRRHCCRRRTRQTLMVLIAAPILDPSSDRGEARPSALSWWMRSIAACSLGAGTGPTRLSSASRTEPRAFPAGIVSPIELGPIMPIQRGRRDADLARDRGTCADAGHRQDIPARLVGRPVTLALGPVSPDIVSRIAG